MYSLLIFENNIYFCDLAQNNQIVIKDNNFIKDDKIADIKSFVNRLKKEKIFKRIKNKLVGETLNFMYWENYNESDFLIIKEYFQELNFIKINFINLNNLLNNNVEFLFVSTDGLHCIKESIYYSYRMFGSIDNTVSYLITKLGLNDYIVVSNNYLIKESYRYADVDSFIFSLLKI